LVTSFGLGFAGMQPFPVEMFARGFAKHMAWRVDVPAIQTWLSTLDANTYADAHADPDGIPVPDTEHPAAITRLHPNRYPLGVRVVRNDTGKLLVRLMWGGGMIGHWGIEVRDRSMGAWPDSSGCGYLALAPGARVWYGLD